MSDFQNELKASSDARLDRWHRVLLERYLRAFGDDEEKAQEFFDSSRLVEKELERRSNPRLVAMARRRKAEAASGRAQGRAPETAG